MRSLYKALFSTQSVHKYDVFISICTCAPQVVIIQFVNVDIFMYLNKSVRKRNFRKMNLTFIILFIFEMTVFSVAKNVELGTIILGNVLFRHGDRTPTECYPNDPYNNETLWPVPYGQLTNLGKHQHLLLGRWLRKRYSHLLPEQYSPKDIYIRSTDVDRTLMSAEANLAGLYPPEGNQVWDKIRWMPIPVHTVPESEDYILAGKKHCPRYEQELRNLLRSPEINKFNKEHKEIYNYVMKETGKKVMDLRAIREIYDTLFIENLYNKSLPEWTKSVFPDKLRPIAAETFKLHAYNKILQRLKIGSLLGEMIQHMVEKAKNILSPDRKLWIYSAHDETIANMLMTLNLFNAHCPPYAATILLELRLDANKNYFVTISYKNTSHEEPTLLTLSGCDKLCPLEDFIKLTQDVIPDDWEKECSLDRLRFFYNMNTSIIGIMLSLVLILFLLVIIIIGFVYRHHKRENSQYYLRLTTEAT